jgi:hypothetical protein
MENLDSDQMTWDEMKLWSTRNPPTHEPPNLVLEYQQYLLRMNVRNIYFIYSFIYLLKVFQNPYTGVHPMDIGRVKE